MIGECSDLFNSRSRAYCKSVVVRGARVVVLDPDLSTVLCFWGIFSCI